MSCSGIFTVDPVTHKQNRRFTDELKEFGGNLLIDFANHTLVRGTISSGEYNKLQIMERGVVDWHSHPRPCLNKDTCTEGLPSPWDLTNHIIGALYGSAAHLVYAAEGTYLIQIRAKVLRRLQASSAAEQKKYVQTIKRQFLDLDRDFKRSSSRYRTYVKQWLTLARRSGFIARLFTGDRVPKITIYYDCHLPKSDPLWRPPINIPAERERFLNTTS